MAITTVYTYPLNGALRDFSVPFEYLARRFVSVTLIGVNRRELVITTDFRFINKTIIQTTKAWGVADGYDFIEVRRNTSVSDRLVDFADGSILRAYELNIAQVQTLHVAEEARNMVTDTIGVNNLGMLDARARRIVNLADAIDPGDAVTLRQEQAWGASALNQANRAYQEAQNALTQANTSTTQANTSTTQANRSTTEANRSKTEADRAATQANLATTNGAAQVSLAQAEVTKATTQATNSANSAVASKNEADRSTTQANLATTNGAAQVDLAKAEVTKATTQANNAASSASTALTRLNSATAEANRSTTEANRSATEADRAATNAAAVGLPSAAGKGLMLLRQNAAATGLEYAGRLQANTRDQTADAVMLVGAFGLGGLTPGTNGVTDWNLIPAVNGRWAASGLANSPKSSTGWFLVDQYTLDSTAAMQVAVALSGPFLNRVYRRVRSGSAWGGWREFYMEANTVGNTISATEGAIIEQGTNANGQYTRFADGTQICRLNMQLTNITIAGNGISAGQTWTFPAPFASADWIGSLVNRSGWSYDYNTAYEGNSATQMTSIFVKNFTTTGRTQNHVLNLIAIGRWY